MLAGSDICVWYFQVFTSHTLEMHGDFHSVFVAVFVCLCICGCLLKFGLLAIKYFNREKKWESFPWNYFSLLFFFKKLMKWEMYVHFISCVIKLWAVCFIHFFPFPRKFSISSFWITFYHFKKPELKFLSCIFPLICMTGY